MDGLLILLSVLQIQLCFCVVSLCEGCHLSVWWVYSFVSSWLVLSPCLCDGCRLSVWQVFPFVSSWLVLSWRLCDKSILSCLRDSCCHVVTVGFPLFCNFYIGCCFSCFSLCRRHPVWTLVMIFSRIRYYFILSNGVTGEGKRPHVAGPRLMLPSVPLAW